MGQVPVAAEVSVGRPILDGMQRTVESRGRAGLVSLAAASGGPFTAAQARQAGYSAGEIQRLARSGQWIAFRRGVYVARDFLVELQGGTSVVPARRHFLDAAAAVIAVGQAVVSHESALSVFELGVLDVPATVTLTRPRAVSRRCRLTGVTVYQAAVPPGHRDVCLGVPVTTPARTVADLARKLPFRKAVTVADAALHARLATQSGVRGVLADCANWPGAAQARRVVQFADPKAESALESTGRVVFAEQGLPAPESQVQITVRSGLVFRADFLWKRYGTIAEADGLLKYSDQSVLRDEKLRQEALSERGYEVVRFTWKQLHEDPAAVAARIRRAFARAARQPKGSPRA